MPSRCASSTAVRGSQRPSGRGSFGSSTVAISHATMLGAPASGFSSQRVWCARWAVGSGWTPRKAKGRASPSSCRSPPTSLEWWFGVDGDGVHNDAVTRVLVIDDEAPIRLLTASTSKRRGWRCSRRATARADSSRRGRAPGCDPPRRHDARARRLGRGGGTDRRRRDARHSDRLPHRACGRSATGREGSSLAASTT